MAGFLDQFRKKVSPSVWQEPGSVPKQGEGDDRIALGVLLWVVAEADGKFLPEENEKIRDILEKFCHLADEDLLCIMKSIEIAAQERIDLYAFTSEVSKDLSYSAKVEIVENLFRVACADRDLDNAEHEMIRKIAGLLKLDHQEFISAKIKIKKEFGLDTAGL